MQYQLNIAIDDNGLQTIYSSGLAVTLVKSVVANPLASGSLPIAWVQFQPLESNLVTWIENYYAYASTTIAKSGATIAMTSRAPTPLQTGWTYTFSTAQFTGTPGGPSGTYTVDNQMDGNFSFGLAQQATVNNVPTLAPLNTQSVPYNMSATFTPQEEISIFLSSCVDNGAVMSQVADNALTVTLTSQNPTANIGFNDTDNSFYLVGSQLVSPLGYARSIGAGASRLAQLGRQG
ncbi:hypothetical protein [Sorangium sp. So ce1000]|uniref:hypothetical protein n=1 Tax=Sorangium sp. So ce1000 TaxID=3133325 RepID=UPI003F641FFC